MLGSVCCDPVFFLFLAYGGTAIAEHLTRLHMVGTWERTSTDQAPGRIRLLADRHGGVVPAHQGHAGGDRQECLRRLHVVRA